MHKHRQRIYDYRFLAAMVDKAHSANVREAEIGRQGQALRASCIASERARIALEHHARHGSDTPYESSTLQVDSPLTRHESNLTDPEIREELRRVLSKVPDWEPGSFGRCLHSKAAPTYDNILERPIRRELPKPRPTERELSDHERNMRVFGGTYWFYAPDPNRERPCYSQLPLEEQRKLVKALKDPKLPVMHYPKWEKPTCRGIGRYRMAVTVPRDKVIEGLVERMGPASDILGIAGDLPVEGFEGVQFSNLLAAKYRREIHKKLQGPTEQMIGSTKVVRGFPVPIQWRIKGAKTFLKPMTYAAFDNQPYDKILDYRMAENHAWVGKDRDQRLPDDMNLDNTIPKSARDDFGIPQPVGFTNGSQPDYIELPPRHPRILSSDLEVLPSNPTPIPKPRQNPSAPATTGIQLPRAIQRTQTTGRPVLERRTSDRGAKPKKSKAAVLGKKRAASAVQLTQYQQRKAALNAQAEAIKNDQRMTVEVSKDSDSTENLADVDSPPAHSAVDSQKENQAVPAHLRSNTRTSRRVTNTKSARQSAKSSSSETLADETDQPNTDSAPRRDSNTLVEPSTAAIQISQPATPDISKSPSVEERNNTISDGCKRRVRWETNLVHTNEQGGCKPHSIYNYSKVTKPAYVHVECANNQEESRNGKHPAAKLGTTPNQRKDPRMIAEMANSFSRNRDRLARNGHDGDMSKLRTELPPKNSLEEGLPKSPAESNFGREHLPKEVRIAIEKEEEEWEEYEMPSAPKHEIAYSRAKRAVEQQAA